MSQPAGSDQKLSELGKMIEHMARMLVDFPDQVEINEIAGENTTVIELKVAKEDLGKIIGKQGRTARAVRTVLNGASTKLRKRTVLEIIE
ncbi:MAG: KH domain-containing protein [Oligoflexia bacterium]|nr:KH domain-containing protein [Oligoflexia bacterium]